MRTANLAGTQVRENTNTNFAHDLCAYVGYGHSGYRCYTRSGLLPVPMTCHFLSPKQIRALNIECKHETQNLLDQQIPKYQNFGCSSLLNPECVLRVSVAFRVGVELIWARVFSRRSGKALFSVGISVKGKKCSNSYLRECGRAWRNDIDYE